MPLPPASPGTLGAILAGGASRRFGAPKALAEVGGRRIVDRVREALEDAVEHVVIAGPLSVDGLETIPDARPGLGPLGGVLAALRRAVAEGRPGVLAAACDLPFLSPALLRLLRARGEASAAAAVMPASRGPRGVEPLSAWYSVRAIDVLESMAERGERGLHRLRERAEVDVLPLAEVERIGEAALLFLNVNTVDDLRDAERAIGIPPAVSIVGRKNAGKTTLVVALLAELRQRGWRVASVKHGHHAFESDQPGRDSWRHYHDGGAEATLMVGAGKVALTMRMEDEPDPAALVRSFYAGRGYDLVLVEGYKAGPFPKVEVFRRAADDRPLLDPTSPPHDLVARVTDAADGESAVPTIAIDAAGEHVAELADLLESRFLRRGGSNAR
jgi:molybdopterin-guanine dinucleotide biosynthesis protein MobB